MICLFFFLLSSLGLFVLFHNRLLNKTRELKEVIRDYTGYKQSAKSTTELLVAILEVSHIAIKNKEQFESNMISIMDVSTENAKGRQMLENAINIRNKDISYMFMEKINWFKKIFNFVKRKFAN